MSIDMATSCRLERSSYQGSVREDIDGKGMRGRRRLCPHCSELVSKATYFRHKRSFYESQTKQWRTTNDEQLPVSASSEEDDDSATPIDDHSR